MKKTGTTKKKSTSKSSKQLPVAIKPSNFLKSAGIIAGVALLTMAAMVVTKDVFANTENPTVKPENIKDISLVGNGGPGWYKSITGSGTLTFNNDIAFNDKGSAAFNVANETSSVELGMYNAFPSVRFENLYGLTYATYVPDRAEKAVTLQIDVDFDLTDTDTSFQGRMVYDPADNTAFTTAVGENGAYGLPITANSWQKWVPVAPDAKWSLTWEGDAPERTQMTTNPCPEENPCTYGHIRTLFPDAGLNGGRGNPIVLRAGDGWNNLTGYADALSVVYSQLEDFLEITYNFEPSDESDEGGNDGGDPVVKLPSNKEQCWNYGWKNFGDKFKNQGQCISYVVHSNQDL